MTSIQFYLCYNMVSYIFEFIKMKELFSLCCAIYHMVLNIIVWL